LLAQKKADAKKIGSFGAVKWKKILGAPTLFQPSTTSTSPPSPTFRIHNRGLKPRRACTCFVLSFRPSRHPSEEDSVITVSEPSRSFRHIKSVEVAAKPIQDPPSAVSSRHPTQFPNVTPRSEPARDLRLWGGCRAKHRHGDLPPGDEDVHELGRARDHGAVRAQRWRGSSGGGRGGKLLNPNSSLSFFFGRSFPMAFRGVVRASC
jgi:hypothetical protein